MEYRGFKITIIDNGYSIEGAGYRILQDIYIPYPAETVEASAKLHIDELITSVEENIQDTVGIEQLKLENQNLKLAIAELAEAQELNKLELQLALAEIVESLVVGGEV